MSGIYTRVRSYIAWIKKHVRDGCCGVPDGCCRGQGKCRKKTTRKGNKKKKVEGNINRNLKEKKQNKGEKIKATNKKKTGSKEKGGRKGNEFQLM